MTDQTESNAPKEPAGGIPQAVADELAQLASELRVMEEKAARSWKTTAIFFVVLLAVIATYLGLLVYRPVKDLLNEESVVQMVFTHVNSMLVNAGAKALDDPGLGDWATGELEKKAPVLMNEHAKPLIEKAMKKLPDWRKQIVEHIKKEGPGALDKGVAAAQKQVLPRVRDLIVERVVTHAGDQLDKVQGQMDDVVGSIIEGNIQNMKDLNPEDVDALKRRMEASMEQKLAPVLDPMFEGIASGIDATHTGLADLVAKNKSGNLSHEDRLEIAMVQLTDALFRLKAVSPEESGLPLWDQIQQIIKQGQQGLGTIPAGSGAAAPAAQPQTAAQRMQVLQDKVSSLEAALKSPDLPDEAKKGLQSGIDAAKKELETLKSMPAGATAPAGPSTSAADTAEALKGQIAGMQSQVTGLQDALKNKDLPAEVRTNLEAQLKKAQKELADLQAKAKQ